MTTSPSDKNPLVFIVEDNEAVAEVFMAAFEDAEYDIEIISDGRSALERLETTLPAVVLLDLHLPHVSGKEILHHIRANERLREIKVILATADPIKAETLEREADIVLVKPVGFRQLRDLAKKLRTAEG